MNIKTRLQNIDVDDVAHVTSLIVGGLGYTLSALILVPHILSCFLINKMYMHLDKHKEEGVTRMKDYEIDSPYYVTMSLVEIATAALKRKGKGGATPVAPEVEVTPPETVDEVGEFEQTGPSDGEIYQRVSEGPVIQSEELGVENTLQSTRDEPPRSSGLGLDHCC